MLCKLGRVTGLINKCPDYVKFVAICCQESAIVLSSKLQDIFSYPSYHLGASPMQAMLFSVYVSQDLIVNLLYCFYRFIY